MKKLNMKRCLTVLIAWIFMFQTSGLSCDCVSRTEVFVDELCITPLIIHGKIIKHIDSKNEKYGISLLGITLIEVIHSFKGKLKSDTLVHINTNPTICGQSIQYLDENQEIFLKGDFNNIFSYVEEDYYLNDNKPISNNESLLFELGKKYQNIEAIFCEPSVIPIDNGIANGEIDYNPIEDWRIYKQLLKENPEKAHKYRLEYIKAQNSPVEEVYAAIRRILKCDR